MSSPEAAVDVDAVNAELAARGARLRFGAALEARFEADIGERRRHELLVAGLASLLVFDLFLINDWLVRPQVLSVAFAARAAVTVWALGVLSLVARPGLAAAWRERLMASTVPVAMGCAACIALVSPAPARSYDPFLLSLVLMAGNIAFPLRFAHALASTLVAGGMAVGLVLAPGMAPEARPWALGLLVGTAVFSLIACWRIERIARTSYLLRLRESLRSQAAQRSADAWAALSQTDALTGLPNRRALDAALALQASAGGTRPLALLLIDVDHFKRFNDHHGHPAGDACLRAVAQAMRTALRDDDLLARYGGEEFIALLPGTSVPQAAAAAERVRAAVQAAAVARSDGVAAVVTVSVGAAVRPAAEAAALVAAADDALYAAKAAGRNRWSLADAPGEVNARAVSLQP